VKPEPRGLRLSDAARTFLTFFGPQLPHHPVLQRRGPVVALVVGVTMGAIDHAYEILRVERLRENTEELRIGSRLLESALAAGDSNHGSVMRALDRTQLVEHLEPARDRQHEVDDDHIRLERFEQAESGEPIRGGADLIAGHSQRSGKNFPRAVVVLDQEHLG
jgi:hypothetical protein